MRTIEANRLKMLKPEYREYTSLKHLILEVLKTSEERLSLDAIAEELAREELESDNFTQFHHSITSVRLMVRDSIYRSIMHKTSADDFIFDGNLIKANSKLPDGRGGKRDGAGRKSGWIAKPVTTLIRVPLAIDPQLMAIAKELDRDGSRPPFSIFDVLPEPVQLLPEPVEVLPEPVPVLPIKKASPFSSFFTEELVNKHYPKKRGDRCQSLK